MSEKTGTDLRREALKMVEDCVCRDRQNYYGPAEDNFANIAALATVVLQTKLAPGQAFSSLDVAAFSACIKLARMVSSPALLDNWIDLAGYAVCGAGLVKQAEQETPPTEGDNSDASPSAHEWPGDLEAARQSLLAQMSPKMRDMLEGRDRPVPPARDSSCAGTPVP
jgi:hypothetical protein